jgi:hypothetical protein
MYQKKDDVQLSPAWAAGEVHIIAEGKALALSGFETRFSRC